MTGAGTRDRLLVVLSTVDVLDRQRLGPVLPVLVLDQDGDGRTNRVGVADAADDMGVIRLDLHAAAAAEALLAAPQLAVQGRNGDGNSSGQTRQRGDEALPVRFSRGFKAKHGIFYGSNNRRKYQGGLSLEDAGGD